MSAFFLFQVLLAFLLAGFWISGVTFLAAKLGSDLGGLVANLPSNILIAMVFMALAHGSQYPADASISVPLGMAVDSVFLFVFLLLLPKNFILAVILSLISWFFLAWAASWLPNIGWVSSLSLYFGLTLLLYWLLLRLANIPPVPKRAPGYSTRQLVLRACFAGSVVGGTVLLSGFVRPFWAGIASTFPAVLLSTLVLLYWTQGLEFSRATGKILILSSSNIVFYALVVRWSYPHLGITLGTVLALATSLAWVYFLRITILNKPKNSPRDG